MRKIFRQPNNEPLNVNNFKRYHIIATKLDDPLQTKENQQIVGEKWKEYLETMGNALEIIKYMHPWATPVSVSDGKTHYAKRIELQDLIYRSAVNDENYDFSSGNVEVSWCFFFLFLYFFRNALTTFFADKGLSLFQ